MGEIRHQHIQAPLAAAISSLAISPQHINEWNEAWPQHRELYALLFRVLIWEDLKIKPFVDVITKAALGSTFSSVILRPLVLVRPESNSRLPTWQPDAQPTEPPVRGETGDRSLCGM